MWLLLKYVLSKQASGLSLEGERKFFDDFGKKEKLAPGVQVQKVDVGGIPAESLTPAEVKEDQLIIYLHGGAYNLGSCDSHRSLASFIAQITRIPLILLEYRLAPEHPFPAAIEDVASAYQWLLKNDITAKKIAFVGDSAGGGLAVATAVFLKDKGVELPGAIVCLSPWTDLEHTGESIVTRAKKEALLKLDELKKYAHDYAPSRNYCNPLVSPIYADLSGLPPMLIHVGENEILFDDSTRLAEKAHENGVKVTLEVGRGLWHVWHYFANYMPEAKRAIVKISEFLQEHLR
jgi:acetyl esterase/lipase